MSNFADIPTPPARIMMVGAPGTGKTGALASLANAGFKLRIIDFDHNLEPLRAFTHPDNWKNIESIAFEDELRGGSQYVETKGKPNAFKKAFDVMDHWRFDHPVTGEEVDLGETKDWGPDTILVLDSLSSMGLCAKRRTMAMLNKTPLNNTQQSWGAAMNDQEGFIEHMTSPKRKFHVICMAHLKKISPQDIERGDSELTKELKERIAEISPTKLFPAALGVALPPVIGGHFPTLVLCESECKGRRHRRIIRTQPRQDIDLKVPAFRIDEVLPLETGLLDIFRALNIKEPNNG